ncbi:hypothetical protein [Treponema sp. UBA3813]|uniref:hypothetical protein n=1 Tax=Treponema sp. UBA3813 TaxID=1947715 RepID=UPI0025FA2C5E|nr:hypothetical protein [Treponema sp. UBA3813]
MSYKSNFLDGYIKLKNGETHYVTISELYHLIDKLKSHNLMLNSISFVPFYKNRDFQLEIDERILYIEQHASVSEEEKSEFYENQKCEEDFYNIDITKRYFLIQKNDIDAYKRSLDDIIAYLDDLIRYIQKRLKSEYNLNEVDFLTGYICFEIYYD